MSEFIEILKEVILPVILLLIGAFLFIFIPLWFGSCYQAKIYNQKNNTNYSCMDFLWASDQINQQTQTIKIER